MSIVKSSLLKVGGIVLATTALAVPSAIAILSNNIPESHQSNFVQQQQDVANDKTSEPVSVQEEAQHTPAEPVKTEPVAELPIPAQEPAPVALTRDELFAKAIAEFKTTAVSGDGNVTGKDFLDRMRSSYLSIISKESDVEYAKKMFERSYTMNMMTVILMRFSRILQNYELFDAGLSPYQMNQTAYQYLINLTISGNY